MTDFLMSLLALADDAGAAILEIYASDFDVEAKGDASPVTAADRAAEAVILAGLARLTPDIPVISEEQVEAGQAPEVADRFWLVDPLDGTKEFIKRNGEFTVNIGLIEAGQPVLGVVTAPAQRRAWWGEVGRGAWARDAAGVVSAIGARARPAVDAVAAVSRSHLDEATLAFLDVQGIAERISAGSALKFCLVAEGLADVYPRFGPTMCWDTAAGHAVLAAAGGRVSEVDGTTPLGYGAPLARHKGFIAWGRTDAS